MVLDTILQKDMKPKATFFDSYGRGIHAANRLLPYKKLVKILERISLSLPIQFNKICYQLSTNDYKCGHLSLYFLLLRSRGFDLQTISKHKFGSKKHWNAIEPMIENLLSSK